MQNLIIHDDLDFLRSIVIDTTNPNKYIDFLMFLLVSWVQCKIKMSRSSFIIRICIETQTESQGHHV